MTPHKFHYVYQITNLTTNKKYIGKRSSSIPPIEDIGKKYFSSSSDKDFILDQQSNPANFNYEVLAEFDKVSDAVQYEIELHNRFDVSNNPEFYNRAKQTSSKFDITGKVPVKDSDGINYMVNRNDPRYLSGELIHNRIGKVAVKDIHGSTMSVDMHDPRYLSGELVPISTGKVTVKDIQGNTMRVDVHDPRYISGELVSIAIGTVAVKDIQGNTMRVDVHDPRYLSGELVGATKGRPMDEYTRQRVKESQTGTRNSNYGTMWIFNPLLKENKKIHKSDSIPNGWIVGRKMKFN